MDWIFIANDHINFDLVKVAVISAKLYADQLLPYCLIPQRIGLNYQKRRWLVGQGVRLLYGDSAFEREIAEIHQHNGLIRALAESVLLRCELPHHLESDDVVLFTDVDIMFTKKFSQEHLELAASDLKAISCAYAVARGELGTAGYAEVAINAGVMLCNFSEIKKTLDDFLEKSKQQITHANTAHRVDQPLLQSYYGDKLVALPDCFNRQTNHDLTDASIIHFTSKKPSRSILAATNEHVIWQDLIQLADHQSASKPRSKTLKPHMLPWFCVIDDSYNFDCIKVAVASALYQAELLPHAIIVGKLANWKYEWLAGLGIELIWHSPTLEKDIYAAAPNRLVARQQASAMARIDVPLLAADLGFKFVLYTDLDVLFCGKLALTNLEPANLAMAHYDNYGVTNVGYRGNIGVQWINVDSLVSSHTNFCAFIRQELNNRDFYVGIDQHLYWEYYKVDKLPPIYNAMIMAGISLPTNQVKIAHFIDPKPHSRQLKPVAADDLYERWNHMLAMAPDTPRLAWARE